MLTYAAFLSSNDFENVNAFLSSNRH
jgi:hypothetical protein